MVVFGIKGAIRFQQQIVYNFYNEHNEKLLTTVTLVVIVSLTLSPQLPHGLFLVWSTSTDMKLSKTYIVNV
jgi:hypothetical protein